MASLYSYDNRGRLEYSAIDMDRDGVIDFDGTDRITRHTTAMHFLQGGVAPEIISLWLGHENPNTTHLYVEADLEMKKKALDVIAAPRGKRRQSKDQDSILRFLQGL